MFLFYAFSWLVEKYKNVTTMLKRFWSEISRMFLCMILGLIILRLKKRVFYKFILCLLQFLNVGGSWVSPIAYGCGFHVVTFFLIPNISLGTLCFTLSLVGMHSSSRFYVGTDEVLIFIIRSKDFWYILKCNAFVSLC